MSTRRGHNTTTDARKENVFILESMPGYKNATYPVKFTRGCSRGQRMGYGTQVVQETQASTTAPHGTASTASTMLLEHVPTLI